MGDKRVNMDGFGKVQNVNDIAHLLQEVEKIIPCSYHGLPRYVCIFCEECLNFQKITGLNSRRVDLSTKVKKINKQCRKKSKARKQKEKRLVKNVRNQNNISNKSGECIQ